MISTPFKPIFDTVTGNPYVMNTAQSHIVAAQMPLQRPLTLVGKISAQSMLGIGPNPITKQLMKLAMTRNDSPACSNPLERKLLIRITATKHMERMGRV